MITLPEINRRNWKKILRELDISKYPSLSKQLVELRNKIIAKEQLGFSEESMGYARLYKYFEDFSKQINSIYIKTIDYSKFSSRPPMPHQIPGVEFLLKNNRCILGDDMGLGKTITTIYATLSMEDRHKVLIVTLKTLKYNFAKEISYLDKRFTIVDKKWSEDKFTIIHYDALKKFKKEIYAAGFTILILDEAHKIRNPKAQRSVIMTDFIKSSKLLKIWLLTGTPIDNRPIDYFHLLKLIKHPLSKNWKNYVERYCDGRIDGWGRWQVKGHSNLEELHTLTQDTFLRRLKTNAGIELPNKLRRALFLELKNKKGYEQAIIDGIQKRYEKLVDEVGYDGSIDDIGLEEMTKLMLYRQFCAIEKVEDGSLNEIIDSILEENEENKIIVFTNFTKVVDAVYEHIGEKECRFIDGRITDPQKRLLIVEEFNADPTLKVLVCNLKVGGTGLNIQSANKIIVNDMDWVPSNMIQAEDRCVFKGQEIITSNGFKKIENVEIGDFVYTHNGNFKRVLDKWTKLERKRLKAIISYYGNNKPLEVTEDHEIFVYDKQINLFKWLRADLLKPNRHFLTLKKHNLSDLRLDKLKIINKISDEFLNNFSIKQKNARLISLPENINLTDDLLYAFGVYIAEGSSTLGVNSGSVVTISGNLNTEFDWINKNAKIICDNFNLKYSIEERKEKNGITTRIYSKELALLFIEWFGKGSHNKKLPDWIWECNEEQIKSLLNGYYAGDGHKRNNSQQMTTVSNLLSSQLILLHSAINQPISIRKEKNTGYINEGEHYSLEFNKIFGHRLSIQGDYIIFRINSITLKMPEKSNAMDRIYDLTVQDDNSFVVGQASVHNSYRIGQKRDVEVIYPVYDGTVEVALYNTVEGKMRVISTVLEGKEEQYFEDSEGKPDTSVEDKKALIKAILAQMGM